MPVQKASVAEQIAEELRARIEAGTFEPGEALPSDNVLAREFGVSKPTVTKARAMLGALGLVESRPGAASIVRDLSRTRVPPNSRVRRARRTRSIYPEGHFARILTAKLVPAPPEVATNLGAVADSPIIQRHRVTYAPDATPLATSITYFPRDLAKPCPALLVTDRIQQGTTLYIEEQTGRLASSMACTVQCQSGGFGPTSYAQQLQLAPNTYVLAVSTTIYDQGGRPLAYEVELHPPDTSVALDLMSI